MTQQKQKKLDPIAEAQLKDLEDRIMKARKGKMYSFEEVKKDLKL